MTGILVAIEGIDGSGKNTQAKLLAESLEKRGVKTKLFSFPCYDETFFGKEIGKFLNGDFGTIDEVHPKFASMLFAGDRFEQKQSINNSLTDGYIVICDRYTSSNIAHQSVKLCEEERAEFSEWLQKLEYDIYGLPKPDITLLLDVPLEISKELVLKKAERTYTDKKQDIHEGAHHYLEVVYKVYQNLADADNWTPIKCTNESNKLRSVGELSEEVLVNVLSYIESQTS